MQDWTMIRDANPPAVGTYLIAVRDTETQQTEFDVGDWCCSVDEKWWGWVTGNDWEIGCEIIAWMPIPSLPE